MSDGDKRPCPAWYAEPQLGIFFHWGIFTIPAWAPRGRAIHELIGDDFDRSAVLTPYSEWYENAVRVDGSPTQLRHREIYGDKPFTDFRPEFDAAAEAFDANAWADFFFECGARLLQLGGAVLKHAEKAVRLGALRLKRNRTADRSLGPGNVLQFQMRQTRDVVA